MPRKQSGVFVILVNEQGELLLGKRMNSYLAGTYGFPGGRLELSETLEECARRELEEETGVKAVSLEFLGVIRERQTEFNFIHFGFVCRKYTGKPEIREPDKCEGWSFYPADKLPTNILPGHLAGIDIYRNPEGAIFRDLA